MNNNIVTLVAESDNTENLAALRTLAAQSPNSAFFYGLITAGLDGHISENPYLPQSSAFIQWEEGYTT